MQLVVMAVIVATTVIVEFLTFSRCAQFYHHADLATRGKVFLERFGTWLCECCIGALIFVLLRVFCLAD